ncbi:MAG: hypothetical protein RLZZ116_1554 [Planctomycetota bacterium]
MSHWNQRFLPRLGGMWMIALAVACAIGGARAEAAVVASWNLNGIDPLQNTVIGASTGTGTLDFGGLGATASVLQGTTLGALKGEVAGDSLAAIGTLANGTSLRLDFETAGYQDLVVSFATRRSATGASSNRLECWTGLAWETVLNFSSNATTWELVSVKLSALAVSEGGYASMRFVLDGATSSSGSLRFDNVSVSGSAVPAPGALALLGIAGCVARRRR